MFFCQYCNKEVSNKGCLVIHEKACEKNPNREKCPNRKGNGGKTKGNKSSNQYIKAKELGLPKPICSEKTKYKLGCTWRGKHLPDEMKEKISISRKKWLQEHKDEHTWKRHTKFKSIPCENLKEYLKNKNINFVEEYEPFDDFNYCVDIAWPDEKIGIEVNGNQHYNNDGSLKEYYQNRHNLFIERGWKLFEIHYSKCYNLQIETIKDILNLPIYDKNYVNKYFSKKEKKLFEKEQHKQEIIKQKEQKEQNHKQIIYNLINNSNIDFSKSGWSTKAYQYLNDRNELWNKGIFRCIKKYYPEFLQKDNVWKRKECKI